MSLNDTHIRVPGRELERQKAFIPPAHANTDYPVIDTDPYVDPTTLSPDEPIFRGVANRTMCRHWRRAFRYARTEDWGMAAAAAGFGPLFMITTERFAPSFSGKGAFAPVLRLSGAIGVLAGITLVWQRSCLRFYGWTENAREVEMDMREMVDKVKKGQPLYGTTELTPYMQGVAARNSRYSSIMGHIIPWPNFVNHNQHGVDTAKYYQQAERELEADRVSGGR